MTVPAFPTSTLLGPNKGAGVILHANSPSTFKSSTSIPIDLSPATISSVSREIKGRLSNEFLELVQQGLAHG